MGALYYEEDLLVAYLGEPLRKANITLYVDTWLQESKRVKLTINTPYGTLIYYMVASYNKQESTFANFDERLERAIVALGGPEDISYMCTITNNHWDGCEDLSGFKHFEWYINRVMNPLPRGAAQIGMYTYPSTYWEFYVTLTALDAVEKADVTQD